ncbi:unnamed protein product [Heligmosomoides polygyrus]|uniref:Endo/exonuclease/phosphatase domain-containing protein n=1 Tax=Heligmosomoides polygyrus TaxID=6339 RepID=A0A183GPJ3_HELPZ|nr:unnamed protein product [Heligmosomoides polygyrus]
MLQDWCKGNFPQFISFHEWAANSPDLNPMDYTVCPALKPKPAGNLTAPPRTTGGVGIIVSERFRDSIVSVERFDYRLMKIVVAAMERLYHFFSAYAPQTGCSGQAKEEFWSLLDEKTAEVPPKDIIIIACDLNGHIGATKDGYSCHGGFGYGSRSADGGRNLEYAESHNLTIVNTVFRKRDSHLHLMDRDRSIVTDAKNVQYDTVAPQHRPLICTLKIAPPRLKQIERCGAARIEWWRMKYKDAAVIPRIRLPTVTTVDENWKRATDAIRQATRLELGTTKRGRRKVDKQTWL